MVSSALQAANSNNGSNMISDQNQCWCVGFSLSFVKVYLKTDYYYFIVYHTNVNITCMSTCEFAVSLANKLWCGSLTVCECKRTTKQSNG